VSVDGVWDWRDLRSELDQWAHEGRVATLWWRDDDAVGATAALRRALDLAQRFQIDIHLSVIPGRVSIDLDEAFHSGARISLLQHGFAHADGELHWRRPAEQVLAELVHGREILTSRWRQWFLPVLVPPWNRIRAEYLPLVSQAGLRAVSADGPRHARFIAAGVEALNIHSGPLAWDGDSARFAGRTVPLRELIEHLRARRTGSADADEPTGFCTHHLKNDDASWQFVEQLLAETSAHTAARWIDLRQVLHCTDLP
jgi:hypothetical protein